MKINSLDTLHKAIASGEELEYLFFWGHTAPTNMINKTCFSQWYKSSFSIDDITYPTAEHYMMAEKAKLFKDQPSWQKVINCDDPSTAKKIGRKVKGFTQEEWLQHRF